MSNTAHVTDGPIVDSGGRTPCGLLGGSPNRCSTQRLRRNDDVIRTRILELGAQALSDGDLLSLVLRARGRRSALTLGFDLLTKFGSLRSVIVADRVTLERSGLSSSNYATLQAALELSRRHYQQLMVRGNYLRNPKETREYLCMRLRDLPHEVFAVVYLDNRNRVIQYKELFRGTIDGASVHPREVVKDALANNAAAAILAHNHPSGVAEPSSADELITIRIKEALSLVDIRVVDHLIIGDGAITSFAERGLL